MIWLLIGYMWLYIHRPFEIWPILAEFSIERIYILMTIAVWLASGPKMQLSNRINYAFLAFTLAVILSWSSSRYASDGQRVVEDYLKVCVFYFLVTSAVRTEKQLKQLIGGFLFCMALYMIHSLREYAGGRYTYNMGTARMMGVGINNSDPNSFASTIINALPMLVPFIVLGRSWLQKMAIWGYFGITVTSVLLTGSRGGVLSLCVTLGMYLTLICKARVRVTLALVTIAFIGWSLLPEDRQQRYMTLIDSERGPASAQESADMRGDGFTAGVKIFSNNTVFGVGPGAFGIVREDHPGAQAHNLYGQLLGELGLGGLLTFPMVLVCFVLNHLEIRRIYRRRQLESQFPLLVSTGVMLSLPLLLLQGFGGHNLFRYTWLWYAAFQTIAVSIARRARPQEVYLPAAQPYVMPGMLRRQGL